MIEAIQLVLKNAKAAGIRACQHNDTPEYAAKAVSWDFDLVTISKDVRHVAGAAPQSILQARKLIGETPATSEKASNAY